MPLLKSGDQGVFAGGCDNHWREVDGRAERSTVVDLSYKSVRAGKARRGAIVN